MLRPLFMTTQRSQSERIASMTCSTSRIVRPSSLQRADQFDADQQFRRVQPREPFIEQQQPRLQRQRARQLQPLRSM